jgi:hypothetical protein
MLPECTYLTKIIQLYYDILHYSDSQRFAAYAISEKVLTGMYQSMVDVMLATVQSHFNEIDYRYLILKDHELTPLVDLIPRFFGENSKVICVVRDPRAVIASMLEVERKKKRCLWGECIKKPSYYSIDNLVSQLFRERKLISDFFMYYWRVQESQLFKNGGIHLVHYDKIVALDEDEFQRLEDYVGFSIGRNGFGKTYFEFDRSDPTSSPGYGCDKQFKNRIAILKKN